MNDIPLTEATLDEEEGWLPIGNEGVGYFTGIFNGDGFKVTGLFGVIADSKIKNLGVVISEKGINATDTSGSAIAGGIVGEALDSIISNCYSNGDISVSGKHAYVGGIAGSVESTSISSSYFVGNISVGASGKGYVGGIAGLSVLSYIYNSHSTGNIYASVDYYASVGGIVGGAEVCTISNSYSSKDISAITNHLAAPGSAYVGGIAGELYHESTITNSYSTGDVSGSGFFARVGGIAGIVRYASISGSYSIGKISAASVYSPNVGGIAGLVFNRSEVAKCAAANPVISANILITESEPLPEEVFINRIIGFLDTDSDAKNNIAYSAMSAFIDGVKVVFNTTANSSRTLEELQKQSTYEGIGWKFGNDDKNPWKIPDDEGFPILYLQP
jgi:hypothetical protein